MDRILRTIVGLSAVAALTLAGCGNDEEVAPTTTSPPAASGQQLSAGDLGELVALFDDEPYTGGQTAPRVSKWITPDSYIFLQFDSVPTDQPTEVRYVGVAVKGVYCAEAQPDPQGK
ncbi:MAG: hypothetical protein ACRD2J_10645, partial [Thermoanaerobaculia bacterium]